MHLSLTKLVGDHGRVWPCSVLKQIFQTMASLKHSPPRNAVLRQTPSLEDSDYSSSAATMNAKVIDDEDDATSPPLLLHASTLHQAHLHRQTTTTTLLLHLLMRTSRCSMSSNLFGHYWQKGEKHMSLIVFKRVHMGGCFIFFLVITTLAFDTFRSLSCNT